MVKPNWNNFKAKFDDNPQKNFEWFCYLLFCKEYNKEFGIFRYKNQSAIENEPIEMEKEVIGWQAKFYDTTLSNHKGDLLSTLNKAKGDYPKITKLILYTNQEWGQNNQEDAEGKKDKTPKGKKEIDDKANELGIELEWRTASYFESPFVLSECALISNHFFTLGNSILKYLEDLRFHTENILNEIQTCISFNGAEIEIDRAKDLKEIQTIDNKTLILSGVAGVGKTALVKMLYNQIKDNIPIYVFKATEFDLRNINEFFGTYKYQEFLDVHKEEMLKIIVIDSAEKLLDLNNRDPFNEYLTVLIRNNWKIIFTSRNHYLEDLTDELVKIYKVLPMHINLQIIDDKTLVDIAEKNKFSLPKDIRLLEFIRNPFYLNEYLRFYKENEEINYVDFKTKLWNKVILHSKPGREQCFLRLVSERVNKGLFFVNPSCETQILDELNKDGILGYESPHGYFITHDIYEEWALEKIIEMEFSKRTNNKLFLTNIGSILPIRRSFRLWLSEKLLLDDTGIKLFIEQSLRDVEIESFWKDEILVSILLSDYSNKFFEIFKNQLLAENGKLLIKLTFLLRTACKEIDDEYINLLGITNSEALISDFYFTIPKGKGWNSLIYFVYSNIEEIGIRNIYYVLPVIYDWVSKFNKGETSKYSGLIALKYYQYVIQNDIYIHRDEKKNNILYTIIYSSSEIKSELEDIFKTILENKWKSHRDPYYDLSKIILTELIGAFVSRVLPDYVIKLADLFWTRTPKKDDYYSHSMGVEIYFGLEDDHLEYFPASAFQTPIYSLLQNSPRETIDFIINFTNKTTDNFSKSDFAKNEVKPIEVYIDKDKTRKQYICDRLWCTFRGTQVSPHVLESMHMALEKYFLEIGKVLDSQALENWLFHILKNSSSTTISGVVSSIIMAFPDKTFNVAAFLFKTKEYFFFDTRRYVLDLTAKSSLLMLKSFGSNAKNKMHDNERLRACDESHRKLSLEHLFLHYQMFRSDSISEEEVNKRQQILWQILDDYYKELPEQSKETYYDKTWRLCLARMDRRKMRIETEKSEDGLKITFNPEIDENLKKYSEESLSKSSILTKYSSLRIWADYKMKNDEKYKDYTQYENNPRLALKEVKEIFKRLKQNDNTNNKRQDLEQDNIYLFDHGTPLVVCAVLIKFHFDNLSDKEAKFCSDTILETVSLTARPDYRYQFMDGTDAALLVLPILLDKFPKAKEEIKRIILINLFNDYPIDTFGSSRFYSYSTYAIRELWKTHFDDAYSIMLGYLYLKPKYDTFFDDIRRENYKNRIHNFSVKEVFDSFMKKNESYIEKIISNKTDIKDIDEIENIDIDTLGVVFQSFPHTIKETIHKDIVKKIIKAFISKLISDDCDNRYDGFKNKHNFLEKLAYIVLTASKNEILEYLKPIVDTFEGSDTIGDLFIEFNYAEDRLNEYENFWFIWNIFKEKMVKLCEKGDGYSYIDKVIKSYLFAENSWKETATEWHTFKIENSEFFKDISEKIGHCPSALYSISKLLNGLGSIYIDEGIGWISLMLKNSKKFRDENLEANTIYYIENIVKKYVYKNREKIKKSRELKETLLVILDYLIEKTSAVGYMVRESIL